MRSVSIVINARLSSSRLPNKLLKPLCGTCLLEIALNKLALLPQKNKYLAAHDPEILQLYSKYSYSSDIQLLLRSPESVAKGKVPHSVAFQHFERVIDDHIMVMNPCHPFTNISTYQRAIDRFIASECRTMTSVQEINNIFFNHNHCVINSSISNEVMTQDQPPVYEMAHVFHILDKRKFLDTGRLWDYQPSDPELFIVNKMDAMDVDDIDDFNICRSLYEAKINSSNV